MKNYGRKFITMFSIAIFSVLISYSCVYAEDIGRITYTEGRVDVLRTNSEVAAPIRESEAIAVGDAVRTKANSKAEITFNDKSVLRLAQNTRLEIKDYTLDKKNNRKNAEIMLDRGKARAIIAKMSDAADFVISTPNAKGKVKGSDVFAFYQSGNSGMLVSEGRLSVINIAHPEKELIVPAGNAVAVPSQDLPNGPRPYFELEKKFHEQDTNIPPSVSKKGEASVIKGVLVKMSGKVKITTKGAAAAHEANLNEIIGEGDTIETGDNGMVAIRFDNGNAINLKPNSKLLLDKLVMDPKTGEYENSFESSTGAIRARIENLKGKSTFKIKTPLAVTGARGTIMYLFINPDTIKAYFEGGNGFISSTLSTNHKDIDAGDNSSANDRGDVTDPAHTTQAEREALEEGWEPGSGTEGYSSPDGTTNSYLFSIYTGFGIITPPESGTRDPFSGFPFTEKGGPTSSVVVVTEEPLKFFSDMLSNLYLLDNSFETTRYEGSYSYWADDDTEELYNYYYYDNDIAAFSSYDRSETYTDWYYYNNGGYKKSSYDKENDEWAYTTGNWKWEKAQNFFYFVPEPPSEDYKDSSSESTYTFLGLIYSGNLSYGILVGTDSLWTATTENPAHAALTGGYYPNVSLNDIWLAHVYSYNQDIGTPTTYDGGAYYGYLIGPGQNPARALMVAIYIDPPDGSGISRGGYVSGTFDGEILPEIGAFNSVGTLVANQMSSDIGIAPGDLYNYPKTSEPFLMSGEGGFSDGSAIQGFNFGEIVKLTGQKWGIWVGAYKGTYEASEESVDSWKMALGGVSKTGSYFLGSITGSDWSAGELSGYLKGIWLANRNDSGDFRAGWISGMVSGEYVEAGEGDGVWSAAGAGEWVEVTELLDHTAIGFTLSELDKFISVPITEVYSSTISPINGSFNGGVGTITGNMDMSFYSNTASHDNGIWAAIVSGAYTGMPVEIASWDANVTGTTSAGAISATITGVQWADNQWIGNINSAPGSAIDFTGQAAGTYTGTDTGTFNGVGTGTWNNAGDVIE